MDEKTKQTLVIKTIWLCWFALIGCFIIKLFGGNYFEIIAKSEEFIKFCGFLEQYYIHDVIKCIFYCCSFILIISTWSREELHKKKYIIILLAIALWLIKRKFALLGSIIEFIMTFTIPLFISKNKKTKVILQCLFGFLVVNAVQLISLFVRNINPTIIKENFVIGLICQIDYYIMLVLYYLYYVKMKGRINMDWSVFWFAKKEAMDKGYVKFINVMSIIGIVLTFPISVPYLLWKKHKKNKMIKVKK